MSILADTRLAGLDRQQILILVGHVVLNAEYLDFDAEDVEDLTDLMKMQARPYNDDWLVDTARYGDAEGACSVLGDLGLMESGPSAEGEPGWRTTGKGIEAVEAILDYWRKTRDMIPDASLRQRALDAL